MANKKKHTSNKPITRVSVADYNNTAESETKLVDSFEQVLDDMKLVHNAKNSDYGNAFEDALNKPNLGLTYAAGLIYNKSNRFVNLHNKPTCEVSESLEDTLLDLANYCVMTIVWLRKKNQKQ